MRLYLAEDAMTVEEAPDGLLRLTNGKVLCKCEAQEGKPLECVEVSTGRRFRNCHDALCRPLIIRES